MEMNATIQAENAALRRDVERLKADLERFRADFSTLGSDAAHAAKVGAGELKDRLKQGARAAAAKGRESLDAVENEIVEHPFLSVGIALGVGLLVGMAVCRKD